MDKDREIKFVGQPILKQITKLIDRVDLSGIIKKNKSDYYYKTFNTRTHLITMLFGVFSRCDSMTEITKGMRALGGKLSYFGLKKSPTIKDTGLDYAYNPVAFDDNSENGKNKKGLFCGSFSCQDTSDKYA